MRAARRGCEREIYTCFMMNPIDIADHLVAGGALADALDAERRDTLLVVAQRVEKYVPARPSVDTRAATTAAASAEHASSWHGENLGVRSWRTTRHVTRRQPQVSPVVEQEATRTPARCADELGRLLDRMQNERRARETVRLEH